MIRITLYKNCILNETYANVFSLGKINNKTILEKYLDTLSKKSFEIENAYQENSGQLVFDYEITSLTDIYDYNYMKVETIDENDNIKILRYCFIQDIFIKNELVYLTYTEDMWHSYIDKITGITESYLSNSRIIDYNNQFKINNFTLPFEYNGNNELEITNLLSITNYMAIIEIQYLNFAQSGESITSFGTQYFIYETVNLSNLIAYINEMVNLSSSRKIDIYLGSVGGWNTFDGYKIGKIIIVPTDLGIIKSEETRARIHGTTSGTYTFQFYTFNAVQPELLKTIEINNNFKNISFGPLSNQIDIINNGNKGTFKILMKKQIDMFELYITYCNKIIEITNNFIYEPNVNAINSSEASQLRLERSFKNYSLSQDKTILNAKEAKGISENAKNIISNAMSINSGRNKTQRIKNTIKAVANIGNEIVDATTDIIIANANKNKINAELDLINAPSYSNITGSFNVVSNILNIVNFLVIFRINSDNDDFVKKAINNLGYNSYEFINDITKLRINDATVPTIIGTNYNVIKFSSVSCYGSFTRNIAKILNGILESGVKIWYNENLQEDNYQVG